MHGVLCALLLVPASVAVAQATSAGPAAVDAWELIHPQRFDWEQAAHRRAVARDLRGRLDLLAGAVPHNTHQE